ncbi:MAG TPA: M1 family metallopeptidase, partial [Methylomirabilota bacterium]|nr:M1 family metallopeptidase [Methylomirabilota bacterium]
MSKKVTRLYEQFQPENYDLRLDVDRDAMTFGGSVTIRGKKVGRPTQRLTLHQKGLKITKATVIQNDKKGDQVVEVSRINNQNSFDEVRLHSNTQFFPGEYTVTVEFKAEVTRPMNGIYPCFFTHDGKEKKLIATQFESHHAREAFPCIDEPEAKATFDLTLTSPAGETVIANTPVKKSSDKAGIQTTSFDTTPKMSTYLLAFVFGELESLEATTKDGVLVRTFATPDNIEYTKFALDCAVKTLEFYNEYFDIPYPLEKCDFIALPDFASGAMENWGCITFREQALLVDPKNTSLHLKQYVANVVAHELTHQW